MARQFCKFAAEMSPSCAHHSVSSYAIKLTLLICWFVSKAPITSLTWGHNDRRLFVATGNMIHVAWVSRRIPSLQHLSRQRVRHSLTKKSLLDAIEMPSLMRNLLLPMFASTVHVSVHQLLIYLALPPSFPSSLLPSLPSFLPPFLPPSFPPLFLSPLSSFLLVSVCLPRFFLLLHLHPLSSPLWYFHVPFQLGLLHF